MQRQIQCAQFLLQRLELNNVKATEATRCKRKAVGSSLVSLNPRVEIAFAANGASRESFECTNEKGNCGCSHSEPRVLFNALRAHYSGGLILVANYSPCDNCANIIIDSKIAIGWVYEHYAEHWPRGDQFVKSVMQVVTAAELRRFMSSPTEDAIGVTLTQWMSARPERF